MTDTIESGADTMPQPAPRVLVLGMGATGASCARYFAARGEAVAFADTRSAPPGLDAIQAALPLAPLYTGPELPGLPRTVERVIVSPGVPMSLPLLVSARTRGLPVHSDIDLFMHECRAPVIAVTGSNGKSTVTAMVGAVLRAAGWQVPVGGNLGTPALDLLDSAADAYALELSSYQLERSQPLAVAAAVLLNLSPDHLDTHGGFEPYAAAKARIYQRCGHAVVNRDAPELAASVPSSVAVTGFTLGEPDPGDFGVLCVDGRDYLACGRAPLLPASELKVAGRHNLANALAALALGAAAGGDLRDMVQGLRSFAGLPHRMQLISRRDGIVWIDDSKATNVGAAIASISGIDGPLVLIAGGDGKGADFSALADSLRGRRCEAVLLGRDRRRIAAVLDGVCAVHEVTDMPAAVRMARSLASPGWTVLLAPAAASLDMFTDFGARGDAFAAAVQGLSA